MLKTIITDDEFTTENYSVPHISFLNTVMSDIGMNNVYCKCSRSENEIKKKLEKYCADNDLSIAINTKEVLSRVSKLAYNLYGVKIVCKNGEARKIINTKKKKRYVINKKH